LRLPYVCVTITSKHKLSQHLNIRITSKNSIDLKSQVLLFQTKQLKKQEISVKGGNGFYQLSPIRFLLPNKGGMMFAKNTGL